MIPYLFEIQQLGVAGVPIARGEYLYLAGGVVITFDSLPAFEQFKPGPLDLMATCPIALGQRVGYIPANGWVGPVAGGPDPEPEPEQGSWRTRPALLSILLALALALVAAAPPPPPWHPGDVGICPCGARVKVLAVRVVGEWGNQELRVAPLAGADPTAWPSPWIPAQAIARPVPPTLAPPPGRAP